MSSPTDEADSKFWNEIITGIGIVVVAAVSVAAGNLFTQIIQRRYQPTISANLVAGWLDDDYFEVENIQHVGLFRYSIEVTDDEGKEYRIIKNGRDSPIIVQAIHSLEGTQLGTVLDSPRARRLLRPELEAVLTNVPGTFSYLTAQDEQCSMNRMRRIGFEYRLYPDQAGEHELNNALVSMDSAIDYAKSRIADKAGRED